MLRTFGTVLLVIGAVTGALARQTLRSPTLAGQLTTAMAEQKLEAIAAEDPDEADRFVAALFFPNAQLLVVSARHASGSLLRARLAHKQYRDVYLDLQASPIANTSRFYQDMDADGLCSARDQMADVVYNDGATRTIFDGDWKKHTSSEKEYQQLLSTTDDGYSRLLTILLSQLTGDS